MQRCRRIPAGFSCLVLLVGTAAAHATGAAKVSHELGPPFYSGEVLPTPQEAAYGDAHVTLIDGPGGRLGCRSEWLYEGPSAALARRLVSNRSKAYIGRFAAGDPAPAAGHAPLLLVGLVANERMAAAIEGVGLAEQTLRIPEQGYLLDIRPEGIIVAGMDNEGLVNAVASLLQLTHVRDGRLVARCATIRDWPVFTTRYTAEYSLPGPAFFDWMALYKINGFGACYPGMNWEGLSEAKRKGLQAIGEYIAEYGTLRFMVQFHVGGRRARVVDGGSQADLDLLLNTIRETLSISHAHHLMLCYDDVKPELQPEERKQFETTAEAHGHIAQRVYEAVKAQCPDTVVSFCPPFYQGRGHRRWRSEAGRALGLPYLEAIGQWPNKDIRIVWTGPVTESRHISVRDIESYHEWLGNKRPLVYWDNTWHYHQPMRNFHAKYPPGFIDYCADKTSYINVNGVGSIGRYFSVTANDYYWNPDAFDSKRARRAAVTQFMGPDAVPAVERLYDVRGEDYFAFFSRDVDLKAFDEAVKDVEGASLTPELPEVCRQTYTSVVDRRRK